MITVHAAGRTWPLVALLVALALLLTALPATTVRGQEKQPAFGKLDKPFGSLGLVAKADTTAMVDGSGFPLTGSTDGLDGADITLSAIGEVKLSKRQAKQANASWRKAKQRAGAGGNLKAGRYIAAVFETAAPPSGDVAFYALLHGPKANDAYAGFPLDPRSGHQLALLVGVLGGTIAAGDTRVAGQALADELQFYNVATETAVWRKGDRWYVLRPALKGATIADIRSQLTAGSQQIFDLAGGGPAVLRGRPVDGLRCFNAIGTPEAAFDGGAATTNILQLNVVVDPASGADLDPAGLQVVSSDGSGEPIAGTPISFDAYGSSLINFPGIPNGRYRLEATTPGAEPIASLLPNTLHFDGTSAGSFSQGIACNSTVEGQYAAGVDSCDFGDPAAMEAAFGLDPGSVTTTVAAFPDGSQGCGWGAPDVFAGASYGVRLATDIDLVKSSLAACDQTELPGDMPSLIAVCPGLVQHVQLTGAGLPDAGAGAGFPSGTAFLLGQNAAVDAFFEPITEALAAGDAAGAAELLAPLLEGDALGYDGFAAAQAPYVGE